MVLPLLHPNPEKMVPEKWSPGKMVPGKNGPRKNGHRKNSIRQIAPWKNCPREIGPRETQKRKIVGWASSIVVCVSNVGMWLIYENPKLDNKPKTRKQTQNTETKNRVVSVEHRGVCVECSDVINLWKPKTRQQTQNSETNPKLGNKKSWDERRASCRVRGMFGCDQSMKSQNSTTYLPGLL